jgi:hypothetical protein
MLDSGRERKRLNETDRDLGFDAWDLGIGILRFGV